MRTDDVANAISMSFLVAFVTPVVAIFAGDRPLPAAAFLVLLFLANATVAGIKRVLGGGHDRRGWLGRPAGATGCDVFCAGGAVGGEPGMPSGHVATVTLFVTYVWLQNDSPWILVVGVPWCIAMAWSRWWKRCHSVPQLVGGALFGVMSGYVSHLITARLM
jgi:hypothetical protein